MSVQRVDQLANWWVHPIRIERFEGQGSEGQSYGQAEIVYGFVDDGTKVVGSDITSSATVFLPPHVDKVPTESRVYLPSSFDSSGQPHKVIASALRDGGNLPTPNHHELNLE